jgi:hypothetical protein
MRQFGDFSLLGFSEINRVRWDECVTSSINSLAYATSWYLDTVTNQNWQAIIYGDYEFVMPLPVKKKLGISYLPTPPFIQQLGVFGPQAADADLCEAFVNVALQVAPFIELNFNWMNELKFKEYFQVTTRTNLVLDLKQSFDAIQAAYSDNLVRNIKKAEKAGIRFNSTSIRSIIQLFRDDRGASIPAANNDWYNTLDQLYNVAALRKKGACFGAYDPNGILLAGMFVIEWQGRSTFLFSGNSASGKQFGALPALINDYLKLNHQNILLFDFEGSDDPGLRRFYESFGAVESNYVHLKVNRLPFYVRWFKS